LFGDTGNPADFKWAFLVAGIGMLTSVIVQKTFQDKYLVNQEGKKIGLAPEGIKAQWHNPVYMIIGLVIFSTTMIGLLYVDAKVFNYLFYLLIGSLFVILFIVFSDKSLSLIEKKKVAVIFVVSFFVVFFWSAFEQAGASLTFFADEQTDRTLGWSIPLWIIYTISILLTYFTFTLYKKAKNNLSANDKILRNIIYLLLAAFLVGLVIMNVNLLQSQQSNLIFNEVPASFFQSLNSTYVVLFAPVFAWLWMKLGKYEPSSPTKMAIGLLLLAIGYLWIGAGVKDISPGMKVSMIWLAGLYMMHTWGELCLSPIGLSLVNKLAPLKLVSLMMAVWFLANAFANKLAGQFSALYPDGKTTSFLGYEMNNMFDFFMLFVILSGIASAILFMLTKYLQKLMNS
jgi:POT family proton-dependent oligopeptide transporter